MRRIKLNGGGAARPFVAALLLACAAASQAHPLGNFTVNHFSRLEVGARRVAVRFVVDMAEVAAFRELQLADSDGDGTTSDEEMQSYLANVAPRLAEGLALTVGGERVPLRVVGKNVSLPPGAGGLKTLRVECEFEGELPAGDGVAARRLRFEDNNHAGRVGWREIVVRPGAGASVFDSTAYGSALTDEIRSYPGDGLAAPLDERTAELSFTGGAPPADARALLDREGRPAAGERDLLAELIAAPEITPWAGLVGLLVAAFLGAMHAMSPGHGKTVVGAYLVGSRGTAKHAAFLGLTVTVTHTAGVFALGLVTLFASQYFLPEKLFPVLSFVSGAIVVVIGLSLFARRLRAAAGGDSRGHGHTHAHDHGVDGHTHAHDDGLPHSHGGRTHTHLPPGADGGRVTWRSLLALGVSGGLLPCPSALVVLLSAIALHRVAYGLLLVVAFSVGLAATLTAVGLAFVYAGRLMKGRFAPSGRVVRALPALSALVITCVGAAVCYGALKQYGFDFGAAGEAGGAAGTASAASVLALGLVFGLKHAVEADHLAAVCAVVSERKSLLGSSLVGGLWGVGHTVSLLAAGVLVILLRVEIGKTAEMALEFCVALMFVALGANAVRKLRRGTLHWHAHSHGPRAHTHPHLHDGSPEPGPDTHHGFRLGARPLVVGMVHGLAGSAALMLLVLSTIKSPLAGFAYILVFGAGSVGGMMAMSALVGLPFRFTGLRLARANLVLRGLAGLFSFGLGLFMAYEIGFVEGLLL